MNHKDQSEEGRDGWMDTVCDVSDHSDDSDCVQTGEFLILVRKLQMGTKQHKTIEIKCFMYCTLLLRHDL